MLGGKNIMVYMIVVNEPLDFNMLLGHDYVYVMNVCGVYTLSSDVFSS
jgi:hypothetical protein